MDDLAHRGVLAEVAPLAADAAAREAGVVEGALAGRAELLEGPGAQRRVRAAQEALEGVRRDRGARPVGAAHEVLVDGRAVVLTAKEFALLAFLAQNRGRVFSRETLLARVWGARYEYVLRWLDGQLRMARKKVMLANNNKALPNMAFLI